MPRLTAERVVDMFVLCPCSAGSHGADVVVPDSAETV